jgi:hypothetical protein
MDKPFQITTPEDQQNATEAVMLLKEFSDAYFRLLAGWQGPQGTILDHCCEKYPFSESFDEVALKMDEWVSTTIGNIKKGIPTE